MPTPVSSRNVILTEEKEMCTAFNHHFVAACHLFKDKYMGSAIHNILINDDGFNCAPQFALHPLSSNVVTEALLAIDSKKATGEDNLGPFLLKLSAP